ncbi:hypothetical protein HK096_004928 [Nowakowskiella sp. JEL0078]|nr:hypothetical protein HK096_004928 [Nowakowskiella sp. JEL0078]
MTGLFTTLKTQQNLSEMVPSLGNASQMFIGNLHHGDSSVSHIQSGLSTSGSNLPVCHLGNNNAIDDLESDTVKF